MYFIIGLIFIVAGFLFVFCPQDIYQIREWRMSESVGEPSEKFIKRTRFSGILCLILGVFSIIYGFISW